MEQNVLNHNRFNAYGKPVLFGCIIFGLTIIGAYAVATKPEPVTSVYSYDNTQSDYGVLAVQITSETTGQAVVNLDGFRVYTSFDFKTFEDTNGQIGGEYTAVDITNFSVDRVFAGADRPYSDEIINADDIRNMISVITAYIEKNKMVRG